MQLGERLKRRLETRGEPVTLQHTPVGGSLEAIQTHGLYDKDLALLVSGGSARVAAARKTVILGGPVRNSAGTIRSPHESDRVVREHYSGSPTAGVEIATVVGVDRYRLDGADQVLVLELSG